MSIIRRFAIKFAEVPLGYTLTLLGVMITAFSLIINPVSLCAQAAEQQQGDSADPASEASQETSDVIEQEKPSVAEVEPSEAEQESSEAEEKSVEPVTALVNARLLTMRDAGEIDGGTVLIQGNKIIGVGAGIEVPEDANVIDLAGGTLTPGFIDLRSRLWLTVAAGNDTGSTAALNAVDGIDPFSEDWREVAAQGVTSVYVQPAARGSLGGFGVILRVAEGGQNSDDLIIKPAAGFQASLGVGTSAASSKAKLNEFEGVKKKLKDASEYRDQWKKYRDYEEAEKKKAEEQKKAEELKKAEGEKGGAGGPDGGSQSNESRPEAGGSGVGPQGRGGPRTGRGGREWPPRARGDRPAEGVRPSDAVQPNGTEVDAKEKPATDEAKPAGESEKADAEKAEEKPKKPKVDALKDRLVEVLEGRVPLRMEVHTGDDVRRALKLAEEFKVSVVLEGLSDLRSGIDDVLDSGLPIVLGPWLDGEQESYHARDRVKDWAKTFSKYNGRFTLASFAGSGRASKELRYHAAAAVAAGFDKQKVLEAVTSNAATLAGIGEQRGKIAEGFIADIAVFMGDPLDPSTLVKMTISDGKIAYDQGAAVPVVDSEELVIDVELPSVLPNQYRLRTQRLLTSDGTFVPGVIQVNDGILTRVQVTTGLEESEDSLDDDGLSEFDLGSAVITPGLVSAHAELTLSSLVDRQGLADSGPLRAADVYDALQPEVRKLVDAGFLRVAGVPGNDRVMAGQAAEIRLLARQPIVTTDLAEKIVLSSAARNRERFPSNLAGQQQLVREAFSGKSAVSSVYLPAAALEFYESAKEQRRAAITGNGMSLIAHVETDAEMEAAISLFGELGCRVTLCGANEWRMVAEYLVGNKEKADSLSFIVRPLRASDFDWYAQDVASLAAAGGKIAFGGQDGIAIRKTAAAAVQAGMPRDVALRALTSDAAKLVGMSAGAGKLESGNDADFVIWSGSPLNLASRPLVVVIDGTLVDGNE